MEAWKGWYLQKSLHVRPELNDDIMIYMQLGNEIFPNNTNSFGRGSHVSNGSVIEWKQKLTVALFLIWDLVFLPSQNKQIVFNASSRFLPPDGSNRCMHSSLDFSKHIFICKMKTYISFKDVRHYIWIQQIGLNYWQKASHKVGYLQEDPGLH